MFKLVRDNIPEIMAADGVHLNYAAAQDDDFFNTLLRAKLVDEVNAYLTADEEIAFETLVDIKTVLDYLIGDQTEEFQQLYDQKLKEHGGYEKKFIGFFAPSAPVESEQADTETYPQTEIN